jgi:hypothetical protein
MEDSVHKITFLFAALAGKSDCRNSARGSIPFPCAAVNHIASLAPRGALRSTGSRSGAPFQHRADADGPLRA